MANPAPAPAAQDCGHQPGDTPAYWGHCAHASCPNYMASCPRHTDQRAHHDPAAVCTLAGGPPVRWT